MVCKTAATRLVRAACQGVGLKPPRTSKRIETRSGRWPRFPQLAGLKPPRTLKRNETPERGLPSLCEREVWKHREPRNGSRPLRFPFAQPITRGRGQACAARTSAGGPHDLKDLADITGIRAQFHPVPVDRRHRDSGPSGCQARAGCWLDRFRGGGWGGGGCDLFGRVG